ncbi:MAG: hypothetical protein LBS74_00875 [Oscillospiraceae bacterium]|jgi:hypothetical protein|nr:hypothetical protein [Oscillospiraceae bacterium]
MKKSILKHIISCITLIVVAGMFLVSCKIGEQKVTAYRYTFTSEGRVAEPFDKAALVEGGVGVGYDCDQENSKEIFFVNSEGEVLKNEKQIVIFATNLLESRYSKESMKEFKRVFIDYHSNNVFVVSFGLGEGWAGGGSSIAVQRDTGKVLLIWAGE